jgi:hypothetical protein
VSLGEQKRTNAASGIESMMMMGTRRLDGQSVAPRASVRKSSAKQMKSARLDGPSAADFVRRKKPQPLRQRKLMSRLVVRRGANAVAPTKWIPRRMKQRGARDARLVELREKPRQPTEVPGRVVVALRNNWVTSKYIPVNSVDRRKTARPGHTLEPLLGSRSSRMLLLLPLTRAIQQQPRTNRLDAKLDVLDAAPKLVRGFQKTRTTSAAAGRDAMTESGRGAWVVLTAAMNDIKAGGARLSWTRRLAVVGGRSLPAEACVNYRTSPASDLESGFAFH